MPITHIKKAVIKIDDTTLHYVCFGTGESPLILLPGLSFQNVKNAVFPLAYMYRMFAKKYTIYVFDKKTVIPDGYTSEIWQMTLHRLWESYTLKMPMSSVFHRAV